MSASDDRTPLLAADTSSSPAIGTQDAVDDKIENSKRPTGFKFAIVFACILLGDFFVGYDTSCVATLTPVITAEFHAIDNMGCVLAMASTVLTFGQLYNMYPMKAIFLASFATFALGSAISATAASSLMFIVGRAVSGLGGSGIFAGGTIIVAHTTPLKYRPIFQSLSGGMECIALALGPIASGVIEGWSSWRVAFAVIVPVCVINIIAIGLLVDNLPKPKDSTLSTLQKFRTLDLAGLITFMPGIIVLIMALQFGGVTIEWSDWRMTILLLTSAVLAVVFFTVQWQAGSKGMFPLGLLKDRTVALGAITQFSVSASLFVIGFYLPLYFQTLLPASPLQSSLLYLPTAVSFAISILLAGPLTTRIGYYTPVSAIGSLLLTLGALQTVRTFTSPAPAAVEGSSWIIAQALFGTGAGLIFGQAYTAVQVVLVSRPEDVTTALVVLSFCQELGGIAALAVCQNVFLSRLTSRLDVVVPGVEAKRIMDAGREGWEGLVPESLVEKVLSAYGETLTEVFWVGVVAALGTWAAVGAVWGSVGEEATQSKEADEETSPALAVDEDAAQRSR
ncbi:hypothetical protein LTR95_001293 [Oleoguttula sp. CCFEE 5521]